MNRKTEPLYCATVILALCATLAALFAQRTPAQTGELHVMISDGMKAVVEEITPQIEQATGRKLAANFNSSKNLRDKIQAGEPFDAAILTSDVLDDLVQKGKIASAGHAPRFPAPESAWACAPAHRSPTSARPDALKNTLLNAKSISFNPTGASAAHTYDVFMRLGITDAVKPKLMLDAEAGRPQMNVAGGKAELVISLIPEVKFFPGVDLVGPIPADLQSYVNFAAGVSASPHDADGAKKLVQFLAGPKIAPVLKAKGMEPHK